jgi:AcrR family transcriptional regulator
MRSSAAASPAPPRRSQAERRATSRHKLLEATIDCLSGLGYAHTTTTEVCQRAGLSQGALFKHFPSKAALVSAAAEHLFAALIDDYTTRFPKLARRADRVAAAIELLWEIFEQPRLHAAFELYLAARTDPELADAMRPVSIRHRDNLHAQARELFPEAAADGPRFAALLGIVLDAMQGAALGAFTLHDPERRRASLDVLTELARRELQADPSARS